MKRVILPAVFLFCFTAFAAAGYIEDGDAFVKEKKYEEAAASYTKAVSENTKNAQAYYKRALAKMYAGDMVSAKEDFDSAIKLAPGNAEFYLERASLVYHQGGYDHAVADYTKAIELSKKQPLAEAFYGRAYAEFYLNRNEEAMSDINKSLELGIGYYDAYSLRSTLKHNAKDYEGAIADLTTAISMEKNDPVLFYNRAISYKMADKYEEALKDMNETVKLEPSAVTYKERGYINQHLKKYKDAEADFSEVVKLSPEDADAYFERGSVRFDLKKYKDAVKDYDKVIELDPNDAMAYHDRGSAKNNLEQYEEALADFEKAVALDPEITNAAENIAITKDNIAGKSSNTKARAAKLIIFVVIMFIVFIARRRKGVKENAALQQKEEKPKDIMDDIIK